MVNEYRSEFLAQIENKKKELESKAMPIMKKMYQSATGGQTGGVPNMSTEMPSTSDVTDNDPNIEEVD